METMIIGHWTDGCSQAGREGEKKRSVPQRYKNNHVSGFSRYVLTSFPGYQFCLGMKLTSLNT